MMFIILSTTFLMMNPDSKLALVYRNIRNSTDGMIIPKMIILIIVIISVIIVLKKNLNKWAIEFRDYNAKQFKSYYGDELGFIKSAEKPWFLFFCKVQILFASLMFITGIYVVLFS